VKCQARVWRQGASLNLRRVIRTFNEGPCTRNAVATLGKLCFCGQHVKLAQDGLIEADGLVAEPSQLADVRRYPDKFPNGLYSWARGIEPIWSVP
jgi:hypothetical protein